MKMVKAYKPETNSVCSGQVLHCPYDFEKAKLVVKEMTDQMVLDLVDKKLVTDQIVLTVGYDIENLNNADRKSSIMERLRSTVMEEEFRNTHMERPI